VSTDVHDIRLEGSNFQTVASTNCRIEAWNLILLVNRTVYLDVIALILKFLVATDVIVVAENGEAAIFSKSS
jgi:hypothetical protein